MPITTACWAPAPALTRHGEPGQYSSLRRVCIILVRAGGSTAVFGAGPQEPRGSRLRQRAKPPSCSNSPLATRPQSTRRPSTGKPVLLDGVGQCLRPACSGSTARRHGPSRICLSWPDTCACAPGAGRPGEQDVGLLCQQMGPLREGLEKIENVGPRLAEVAENLISEWT